MCFRCRYAPAGSHQSRRRLTTSNRNCSPAPRGYELLCADGFACLTVCRGDHRSSVLSLFKGEYRSWGERGEGSALRAVIFPLRRGTPRHLSPRERKNKKTSPTACFFAILFAYFFITSYAPAGTYLSYGLPYFIISRTNVELTNESSGDAASITVSTSPVSLLISASDTS